MNELLKPFTSTNFLWGLGIGVISYLLVPVLKDSLKPMMAGAAGVVPIMNGVENPYNNTPNHGYDLLAEELRKQREFTVQQLSEIAQQLANLQREINTLKA